MKTVLAIFLFSSSVLAHPIPGHTYRPSADIVQAEGQFFSIRMVRGEPTRFFVLGKEQAKLDLSTLRLTLKKHAAYKSQTLSLDLENNYFVLPEPVDFEAGSELELTASSREKTETLQIRIKDKAP